MQDIELQDIKYSRGEAIRLPIHTFLPKQWESALLWVHKQCFFKYCQSALFSVANIALQWVLGVECWPALSCPCLSCRYPIMGYLQEVVGVKCFLTTSFPKLTVKFTFHHLILAMDSHEPSQNVNGGLASYARGLIRQSELDLLLAFEWNAAFSDCLFSISGYLVLSLAVCFPVLLLGS